MKSTKQEFQLGKEAYKSLQSLAAAGGPAVVTSDQSSLKTEVTEKRRTAAA